ncbi:hypothetical protein OG21DRAFT_1518327 [Imleria badia]|nr:hypothetical protein OG21DRAFT_1518327 [Imleria badia]
MPVYVPHACLPGHSNAAMPTPIAQSCGASNQQPNPSNRHPLCPHHEGRRSSVLALSQIHGRYAVRRPPSAFTTDPIELCI